MKAIHTDNAKEFVGTMLQRACEEYNITRLRRIPKKPYLGGHVERLMRTFMQQVHELPGTTFSNSKEKGEYNSIKEAALTLREFEYWFSLFIVNIYHRRIHSSLNQSPFERYREGIMGSPRFPQALGVPARLLDEERVRLDFMPGIERTVQRDGVVIGRIHYNADILRPYITGSDDSLYARERLQKFIFKRDPRDISVIYFLDPVTKKYHPIPYRNTNHPKMSAWEHQQVLTHLRKEGKKQVPEELIMTTKKQMQQQVATSIAKTKRKKIGKKAHRFLASSQIIEATTGAVPTSVAEKAAEERKLISNIDFSSKFSSFLNLDDESFTP